MPRSAVALLLALTTLAGAFAAAAPAARAAPLSVTLGFDDGYADQTRAADILGRAGMPATYFVISGLLDRPGRLTTAQALALQAAAGDAISSFHAAALYEQGRLAVARGDLATGRARFDEDLALQRQQGAGSTREAARALAGIASTLASAERPARCRALLGEASAIDARILAPTHPERQAIERELATCP